MVGNRHPFDFLCDSSERDTRDGTPDSQDPAMLGASIMVGNPPPGSRHPQYGRYTSVPIVLVAGIAVCVALLARWRAEFTAHRKRVESLQWRIHVNGIRGKSTVTRIIAGMMREAGIVTIPKANATFAAVLNQQRG